jgi:hypothetical protein
VFERNHAGADAWDEVQKLTSGDTAIGDDFGATVAISGDTLLVGAPYDDHGSSLEAAGSVLRLRDRPSGPSGQGQLEARDLCCLPQRAALDRDERVHPRSTAPQRWTFQSILVSEFNTIGNPVQEFVFERPDGTMTRILSPDPGRAVITGSLEFEHLHASKIPPLWGVEIPSQWRRCQRH